MPKVIEYNPVNGFLGGREAHPERHKHSPGSEEILSIFRKDIQLYAYKQMTNFGEKKVKSHAGKPMKAPKNERRLC